MPFQLGPRLDVRKFFAREGFATSIIGHSGSLSLVSVANTRHSWKTERQDLPRSCERPLRYFPRCWLPAVCHVTWCVIFSCSMEASSQLRTSHNTRGRSRCFLGVWRIDPTHEMFVGTSRTLNHTTKITAMVEHVLLRLALHLPQQKIKQSTLCFQRRLAHRVLFAVNCFVHGGRLSFWPWPSSGFWPWQEICPSPNHHKSRSWRRPRPQSTQIPCHQRELAE